MSRQSRRSRTAPSNRSRRKANGSKLLIDVVRAVEPPTLPEGKWRCPICRNAASPTPKGRLYKHRDLFGDGCWNREPAEADAGRVPSPDAPNAPNAYPDGVREAAIEAVRSGRSPYSVSQEVGVNDTTIRKWCDAAGVTRRRYHRQDADDIALAGRWVRDGLIWRHETARRTA